MDGRDKPFQRLAPAGAQHPAAILGEHFADLNGLLVTPDVKVVPAGLVETHLWGESALAAAFDVTAPVSVQVACRDTTSADFAVAVGHFQIRVTPDPNRTLRARFLREIYDYWREMPKSELDAYENLPADKSVLEKNGRYVLYIKPGNERPGATYLFYANQRVFEIEFQSLENDGWGALSMLIADHLAFREQGETIDHIYFEPKFPPRKLMALYEKNALR